MGFLQKFNMWRNMEEFGRDWCICGYHVYHEIWEAATGAVTPCGKCTCQLWPEQSDYTARMAHVSH